MLDREADTAAPHQEGAQTVEAVPGVLLVHNGVQGSTYQAIPVPTVARLGRGTDAGILLDDPSASRLHAEVRAEGAGLVLEDLRSAHGTFLNGTRMGASPVPIAWGDVIRIADCVMIAVDNVADHRPLEEVRLRGAEGQEIDLVGAVQAHQIHSFAQRFGPTSLAVLIVGETGTGKEVVAAALHASSGRSGPLVGVNCAALPDELAESLLFGHRKGAFSGAAAHQTGFFEAAAGGTLLLDEVGEVSAPLQAKLLRAIETSSVTPLGATTARRVDVRILAATSRDLQSAVKDGSFRSDLYHRLHGVSYWVPPLRERIEELPLLVQHFLRSEGEVALSASALERLLIQPWPGNIRELRQCVLAAAVRARVEARSTSRIEVQDLQTSPTETAPQDTELSAVVEALRRHDGNVSRAAQALGLHRAQIYRILQANRLRSEDFRG